MSDLRLDKIKKRLEEESHLNNLGRQDFLIIETLVLIAEQNEKMIRVLNKINHNIIRTIDFSR